MVGTRGREKMRSFFMLPTHRCHWRGAYARNGNPMAPHTPAHPPSQSASRPEEDNHIMRVVVWPGVPTAVSAPVSTPYALTTLHHRTPSNASVVMASRREVYLLLHQNDDDDEARMVVPTDSSHECR